MQKKKKFLNFSKQSHVAKLLKISNIDGGYRTLSNIAKNGGQEVPHLFISIYLEENTLGKMISN